MIVRIDYPEADARLDLWGGTSGVFAGIDRFGRVIDQRWQNAVTTTPADIDRYKYGYDRNSNRTWKQNVVSDAASVPLDEFYTYDRLNRLTSMARGTLTGSPPSGISGTPVKAQDWTLDPVGNWNGFVDQTSGTTDLDQSRTASPVNQITGITETAGPSWVTPQYDPAGNTTTFPQPNPTSGFTVTYDAWNRMKDVNDGSDAVAKYDYDGRNRRIVEKSYTAGTLSETRHVYFTTNWQNIEERVGSATTADKQHVWGVRYIDELICRDDATPQRIYSLQDANFNVTGLNSSSGTILQRFVFEPYGKDSVRTAAWAATTDVYNWVVRFQGGTIHTGTGLYHFRNRHYQRFLGTWVGRDPAARNSSVNLYLYTAADPINMLDPWGLHETSAEGAVGQAEDCDEQQKCCCCAEDVTVEHLERKIDTPERMGHDFDVVIKMKHVHGRYDFPCRLEWWETTDVPAFTETKKDERTDMYKLLPRNITFSPWNRRTQGPCPGSETVTINDKPALNRLIPNRTVDRTTKIEVIVKSAILCPHCEKKSASVTVTQHLTMVNSVPDWSKSDFKRNAEAATQPSTRPITRPS